MRAGGGCARNDCRCARRRNTDCQQIEWRFQFRFPSLYNLCSLLANFRGLCGLEMLSGTSAMLCNVLTPRKEVWRAKFTPFLLPHPLLGRSSIAGSASTAHMQVSNPSYVVYTIYAKSSHHILVCFIPWQLQAQTKPWNDVCITLRSEILE